VITLVTLLCATLPSTSTVAQAAKPQKAIEKLEGCSREERQQGCINILKQRKAGDNRLEVKAQVRGKRIIWYEYNKQSGAVRRTN
jgi:hypothetical protein